MLRRIAIRIVLAPVRFYQRFISPAFPPSCRFAPTCSNYAVEAVTTHGPIKGVILATWRILRCNPWNFGGVDHVPPRGRWKPDPWVPPADWAGHDVSEPTPLGMDGDATLPSPREAAHASLVDDGGIGAAHPADLPANAGRPLKTMSSTNVRSHECSN